MTEIPETALEEAQRITLGDRQQDYGHPYENYAKAAALQTVVLGGKLKEPLTAEDVIMLMMCVKLSREIHKPTRDNRVDMIGYASCLDRCYELTEAEKAEMRRNVLP
jgi:hypothetical protein